MVNKARMSGPGANGDKNEPRHKLSTQRVRPGQEHRELPDRRKGKNNCKGGQGRDSKGGHHDPARARKRR